MTTYQQQDVIVNNDRALQQLAWAIQASLGQFKLILARCNYASLRDRLVDKLRKICNVDIRLLHLKESDLALYTVIREELGAELPASLMVLGLDSVRNLPQMLTSANQVREEFRNNLPFPLVLWIDDQVYKQMILLAPDLESWATTKSFTNDPTELCDFLQQTAEELLAGSLNITSEKCSEIKSACEDLRNSEPYLEIELKARIKYLLGLVEYFHKNFDNAVQYYHSSLAFWQEINNLEMQGIILKNITLCYYYKARKTPSNRPQNKEVEPREKSPSANARNFYLHRADLVSVGTALNLQNPDSQETRNYLRQCLEVFAAAKRPDLIATSIDKFGIILRDLQDWEQLQALAERALPVHQKAREQIKIAQDYGFLAEVALAKKKWFHTKELTEQALATLSNFFDHRQVPQNLTTTSYPLTERYSYLRHSNLFLLAQAQQHLRQYQAAIANLQTAREIGVADSEPQLYIDILNNLQWLLFQQKQYLEAYQTKLERRSIEQQFGLRAFIGAGRLEATRQELIEAGCTPAAQLIPSLQANVAPEIAASGRQLDVERLIERIGRPDHKLIVIHGQSGVGKSSLVNAGMIPALKKKAIGIQDNLPVVMRVYTNWVEELAKLMLEVLRERGKWGDGEGLELATSQGLLSQLRDNEQQNLRTILIFDQFEEFFFVYPKPRQRQQFFEFLGECLNVLSAKVILSLRVDYLHYLLECNDLPSMTIISNDILSTNVLYKLGNFSPADTKSIIQRLTQGTSFRLEPALVEQLVQDLAGELGEVRPIELQVVGAQLQTENIRTLAEYQQRGPKQELVKRYVDEVVEDCGIENRQAAELVLYLLTDEKGTRPLKTRAELERDLRALATDLAKEASKLDLVLQIFVKSGLVVLLPENPADRYQLVHDYIAAFIRQQQEPKLKELMAELERERKQRKQGEAKLNRFLKRALMGSVAAVLVLAVMASTAIYLAIKAENQRKKAAVREIEALTNYSDALFASGRNFDALIQALRAVGKLNKSNWATTDTQIKVVAVLRQALHSLREYNRLEGHHSAVFSLSFSPDGRHLASASGDNTVKLWDVSTGQLLKTLTGHNSWVYGVSFSPDGRHLASASDDNSIKLWDVATGKLLKTLTGHDNAVSSVSFSPDGRYLASGSTDKTIKLWDVATDRLLHTFNGHHRAVLSVNFSPNGRYLASGSEDKTIKLWDVTTSKLLKTLTGHENAVKGVSFSPDGKKLASGSADKTIKLWDVTTGKLLHNLIGHTDLVNSISFSPDGKKLASGSQDQTIKLWDVTTGKIFLTLIGHNKWVNSVSFSPDGQTLASAGAQSAIALWNIISNKQNHILKGHSDLVNNVSFSPDGKKLASASADNNVKVWDVATGKLLHTFAGDGGKFISVSFSPDGRHLAAASTDRTIKLWDVATNQLLYNLIGHTNPVFGVSFSPDGKTLASGSYDKTIKFWDVATGKQIKTLIGHSDRVQSVSFSPDGKTLASGSHDKTIKLWDVVTGEELHTLNGHSGWVLSVSFSPDGQLLASGSADNTIKLWDVATGKLLNTLNGHTSWVYSVSFSPDGQLLASSSWDQGIKLWEVATGKQVHTLKGHSDAVYGVSFSPDGQHLASASGDKTVILWDLNLNELLTNSCNWLSDYLVIHPDDLQELKVCQNRSRLIKAAPALVAQGEDLARKEDIDSAVAKFQKALEWNPHLNLAPKVKAQQLANASVLVEKAEKLAQMGNIEGAVAQFQKAKELDSSLDLNPQTKAHQLVAEAWVMKGESFLFDRKVKEAIAFYKKAQQLDPQVATNNDSWYKLCLQGNLQGYAKEVLFACEKAVQLVLSSSLYDNTLDQHGLARALTGDTQGAIKDFEAYIAQTNDQKIKAQRQRWVNSLRAGKNPFTPEELKSLQN